MHCNALIPVKPLYNAKSRLRQRLPFEGRRKLVLEMLDHVITVLLKCKDVKRVTVVTSDNRIVEHVSKFHIHIFPESGSGHNHALIEAAEFEKHIRTQHLLSISSDLPILKVKDIQQMIKLAKIYDVVLASSKDGGTNALLTNTPLSIPFVFGKKSLEKFIRLAKNRNLSSYIYTSNTSEFDIDTVEDVALLGKIDKSYTRI